MYVCTQTELDTIPCGSVEHPQHGHQSVRDPFRAADVAPLGSDVVDAQPDAPRALADARALIVGLCRVSVFRVKKEPRLKTIKKLPPRVKRTRQRVEQKKRRGK